MLEILKNKGEGSVPSLKRLFQNGSEHDQKRLASLEFEETPILMGHSFGGATQLIYAWKNRKNVKALILLDPAMEILNQEEGQKMFLESAESEEFNTLPILVISSDYFDSDFPEQK